MIKQHKTFDVLSAQIKNIHQSLQQNTVQSVNRMLSMRNWLIGRHIVMYEQHGEDRAKYGNSVLDRLSESLKNDGTKGMSVAALRSYRQFYLIYPQLSAIFDVIPSMLESIEVQIQQTVSVELQSFENQSISSHFATPKMLIKHFTFSHFIELLRIWDNLLWADPLSLILQKPVGLK